MRLISLTVCRNEEWCIGATLRIALQWCDHAVVLIHASTDRTQAIVERIAEETGRVTILNEPDPTWREMEHRQRTLTAARILHATHCAVVDADEALTGNLLPMIRDHVAILQPGQFLGIPFRNLHRSIYQYRSDGGIWGTQAGTMIAFADTSSLKWHAANGYDHHQRSPLGSRPCGRPGGKLGVSGGVMHLQFASWPRLVAKHVWYKLMERIKYPSKPVSEIERVYSMALDESACQTSLVPAEWWESYVDLLEHLDVDAEPWQKREARELWEKHGSQKFAGLNTYSLMAEALV